MAGDTVITIIGTLLMLASMIAGKKFAAAVPEVHTTTAGIPAALPIPSAKNAAARSSMIV